jgi:hypothetical protein
MHETLPWNASHPCLLSCCLSYLLCLKWSQTLQDSSQSRTLKDRAQVITVEAAFVHDFITKWEYSDRLCTL